MQPTETAPTLTAVPPRKIRERDVFPCAFCDTLFNSVEERRTHELICTVDPPAKRVIDLQQRYEIVLAKLPSGYWEAKDLVTFDDCPDSRLNVRGHGKSTCEAVTDLLEQLAEIAAHPTRERIIRGVSRYSPFEPPELSNQREQTEDTLIEGSDVDG